MSAFLCEYETIAKAASCGPEDELGENFHELMLLNADGYGQRYSHHEGIEDECTAWCQGSADFLPIYCADRVEAYYALRCVLYQASEGDVPEGDAFKRWDRISNGHAQNIAHGVALGRGLRWNA